MKIRIVTLLLFCASFALSAQNRHFFPDVEGYHTLTGDMHVHTRFSDGDVWPTSRIDEAYLEGIDVICITDHIDDRHKKMVKAGLFNCDRNESYRIAAKHGKKKDVIVIHGGEVSRGMPPGHFNTLFISDNEAIAVLNDAEKDHFKAMQVSLREARKQNSFNVWNHPHWSSQAPNETKWYSEHTKLYKEGLMDAIEIYNGGDGYSPEAHQWAIDRNLALIGGTDTHNPIALELNFNAGVLRPCTLIFAKERTVEGVEEALWARRTAVYGDGMLYGSEEVLRPLFEATLVMTKVQFHKKSCEVVFENKSNVPIVIRKAPGSEEVQYRRFKIVQPHETYTMWINGSDYHGAPLKVDEFYLSLYVENYLTAPGKPLLYKVKLTRPQ